MKAISRATALCLALLVTTAAQPGAAQMTTGAPPVVAGAKPVTIERIKVHAPTIAGNLEGEAADRDVLVVLPPSYAKMPQRRYPVVYALHGYSIGAEQWTREIHVPQTVEGAFANGAHEMIIVLPDSKTVHNGSMYSASVTTGDFETFIARDLVRYIDSHYRTIARPESRGLAGHSMGGYGTSRIGMKHGGVFGALYMLSPCCLSPRDAAQMDPAALKGLEAIGSPAQSASLPFLLRAQLATAAAWSPNPKKPPLYLDLPVKDGVVQPDVLAKWAANAPLAFVDQYVGTLRGYRAIAIDVGDKDGLKNDARKLHEVLDSYGITNSFEIYDGDHTSHVAMRFQDKVLPFFSEHLAFPQAK
ncbi:MAG: esterase [Sphingobium sp.]|nr:MAG: esterase [Sphingobium sp.]